MSQTKPPSNVKFLSGFVALTGPPNAGKSTLLNRLLGTKVAIVSPKPQTTRNRILGIYHGEDCQIVFMDTPGIHGTRTALHQSMVASAKESLQEVDMVAVVIDWMQPASDDVDMVMGQLKKTKIPSFLILNKIDTGSKHHLLPVIDTLRRIHPFDVIVPVSALTGDGVDRLVKAIRSRLEPGPPYFPKEMTTDQPEAFMVSEIIREKIYMLTQKELPYASAVTVESMVENTEKRLLVIHAKIHVETDSQKKILVGKGGHMVKSIGREARLELERLFNIRVFLDLLVRVEKNWSRDTRALRRLGY